MKRLCATVLIMEAVVIGRAIPVAVRIDHASARAAGIVGGVAAVAAVLLAVLARRRLSWTLIGGSLLQLFVVVSGAVVPVMYLLGAIFGALWATGIWLGHRVESAS
jgi:Protein of unknown function (DUF4233)